MSKNGVAGLNERELELGIAGTKASWHEKYSDSAWIYVGGLPRELVEGDVICVLSQLGEIEDFDMPRDKKTGKPRGWCWCKYEDQRSTILAVDNFNGTQILGRTLRVDHCEKYKLPKDLRDRPDKFTKYGMVYDDKELASSHTLQQGVDLWAPAEKKKKKKKSKKRRRNDDEEDAFLLPYDDKAASLPVAEKEGEQRILERDDGDEGRWRGLS